MEPFGLTRSRVLVLLAGRSHRRAEEIEARAYAARIAQVEKPADFNKALKDMRKSLATSKQATPTRKPWWERRPGDE